SLKLAGLEGIKDLLDLGVISVRPSPTVAVTRNNLTVKAAIAGHLTKQRTKITRLHRLIELNLDDVADVGDTKDGLFLGLLNLGLGGGLSSLRLGLGLSGHDSSFSCG